MAPVLLMVRVRRQGRVRQGQDLRTTQYRKGGPARDRRLLKVKGKRVSKQPNRTDEMSTRNWKLKGVPRVLLALLFASTAPSAIAATFDLSGGGIYAGSVTAADTDVENTATLSFQVSGITQDTVDDTSTFKVDRLLDVGVSAVTVPPLQIETSSTDSLQWNVTNESNDVIDLEIVLVVQGATLDPVDPTGGGSTRLASSDYAIGIVCVDTNGDGDCSDETGDAILAASGALATVYTLDAGASDYSLVPGVPLSIVADVTMNANLLGGRYENLVLAAAVTDGIGGTRVTRDDNNLTSPDDATSAVDATDEAGTVENVFADANVGDEVTFSGTIQDTNSDDTERNGQASDAAQFQVVAPVMTVTKTSRVIYDPIVGLNFDVDSATATLDYPDVTATDSGVDPNRIPGAIIEYTIAIANDNSGGFSSTADSVSIVDTLAAELAFGLTNTDLACNSSATGAFPTAGPSGGSCDSAVDASDWENVLVTSCADGGAPTTTAVTNAALAGAGQTVGNCQPGDTATIVYWTSVQ